MTTPSPDSDNDRDSELMLLVKAGDWSAFEEIVRRYQKELLNFFVRGGVSTHGEDLAQKTFIRLYNYRSRYQPTAKLRTFLYLLARQVYIDELRQQDRYGRLKAGVQGETPDFYVSNPDAKLDVAKAMSILSDGLRDVVIMAFMEGLPYEEIAERLEIPLGTVKSRVFTALRKMRDFLEGDGT